MFITIWWKNSFFVPSLQSAVCIFVLTKSLTVSEEELMFKLTFKRKCICFNGIWCLFYTLFDVCFIHYLRFNFCKIQWELKILIFLQASKYCFIFTEKKDTNDQLINFWDSVCLLGVYLLYSKLYLFSKSSGLITIQR